MKSTVLAFAVLAGALGACGASHLSDGGGDAGGSSSDAAASGEGSAVTEAGPGDAPIIPSPDAGLADGGSGDPFAPQPDESQGLTNVSADLDAVLENGALAQACASYQAGKTDAKTKLLCGKWMYFYDTFGTSGIPAALVEFLSTNFPVELGLGFSKLGLVPDPTSTTNLPLGMVKTAPLNGTIDAVAFTCASCHFGKLPDGRYAVGAPNHMYDYARHILDITLVPGLALGLSQPSAHDPGAIALIQPVLDALNANATLKNQLLSTLLPLVSLKQPALTTTEEQQYTTWPSGTMDFLIAPLPVDDGVHVVSKIQALWGIPSPAEVTAAGMPNGLLASTGDAPDLVSFVTGFATVGASMTIPTPAQIDPLVAYIESLRAPDNPSPPDAALVATGKSLYASKGCITCHGGPRGSGTRVYSTSEIGTDPTLAMWADPDGGADACCGVPTPTGGLTRGMKSPRLVGMWAMRRFLHNGALSSLDELFCLGDAGRPPPGVAPMLTTGHDFTCTGLSDPEKQALLAYMLAH